MEQLVRVRQTFSDGTAEVLLVRESACSGDCHKCSGCGAAKETMIFTAQNAIGAGRGDLVKVESATGPVMKAATVLYVLPLVLFFLGYYLGTLPGSFGTLLRPFLDRNDSFFVQCRKQPGKENTDAI